MFDFDTRTRALLDAIWRHGSVSAAATALGLDPSNARRHLATAERRAGTRLVERRRGGRRRRNAWLTDAGRRLVAADAMVARALDHDADEGVTPLQVGRRTLHAAGRVPAGPVSVRIPPAAVGLERPDAGGGTASPRNRVPGRVTRLDDQGDGRYLAHVACGSLDLRASLVRGAVRDLRLKEGSRVVAVIKATAIEVRPLDA